MAQKLQISLYNARYSDPANVLVKHNCWFTCACDLRTLQFQGISFYCLLIMGNVIYLSDCVWPRGSKQSTYSDIWLCHTTVFVHTAIFLGHHEPCRSFVIHDKENYRWEYFQYCDLGMWCSYMVEILNTRNIIAPSEYLSNAHLCASSLAKMCICQWEKTRLACIEENLNSSSVNKLKRTHSN